MDIGRLHASLAHAGEARAFYEQALALNRAVDSRRGAALTLTNLGILEADAGHAAEARRYGAAIDNFTAWPTRQRGLRAPRAHAARSGLLRSLKDIRRRSTADVAAVASTTPRPTFRRPRLRPGRSTPDAAAQRDPAAEHQAHTLH